MFKGKTWRIIQEIKITGGFPGGALLLCSIFDRWAGCPARSYVPPLFLEYLAHRAQAAKNGMCAGFFAKVKVVDFVRIIGQIVPAAIR